MRAGHFPSQPEQEIRLNAMEVQELNRKRTLQSFQNDIAQSICTETRFG